MTGQELNRWSRNACIWVCALLWLPLGLAGCTSRPPRPAGPSEPVTHGKPILAIALDLSGSTRTLESTEQTNVTNLLEWAMRHQAEVVVTAIDTTSAAHSVPLVDVNFDVDDGGNRLTRQRLQKPLKDKFGRALQHAFDRPRGGSDIMGAVVAAGQGLTSNGGTRPKILAVVSDGWNFTADRQLRFTETTLTEPAATLVRRAQQDGLVPDLSGITAIYFGGGGQASDNSHPSPEVARLKSVWMAYFAAAKGPVPQWAAVLSLPK